MKNKIIIILLIAAILAGCNVINPRFQNSSSDYVTNTSTETVTNTESTHGLNTTTISRKTSKTSQIPSKTQPQSTTITPLSATQLYGYTLLQKESNKNMLVAYKRFVTAVDNINAYVDVKDLSLTQNEIGRVFNYYYHDYPNHFWRKSDYRIEYVKNNENIKVTKIYLSYYFNGSKDQIKKARQAFDSKVKYYLSGVTTKMSNFEKELTIHDKLVKTIEYDITLKRPNIFTAYGALVDNIAVCDGYTRAFQYLLNQVGIPNIVVCGQAKNEKGKNISHAWNLVRLDKEYYHIDITWDDVYIKNKDNNLVMYYYFNLNDSEIFKNHFIQDTMSNDGNYRYSVPIPKATGTKYNYFKYKGLVINKLSVDNLSKIIIAAAKNNSPYVHFKTTLSLSSINSFIAENFSAIQTRVNSSVPSQYKMGKKIGYYSSEIVNVVVLKFA